MSNMKNNRSQCGSEQFFLTPQEQLRHIQLVRQFELEIPERDYFKHWHIVFMKDSPRRWICRLYAPLYTTKHFIMHLVESRIHHSELSFYVIALLISLHFMLIIQAVPTPSLSTNLPLAA